MTVLAIERVELTDPQTKRTLRGVHMVADSRISRGGRVTSEIAPKILAVPMAVTDRNGARMPFHPYAFGFAGSVNSALLTHATAQHFLMALFGDVLSFPPTVREVAQIYRDAAEMQVRAVGEKLSPADANFALIETVICGYSRESGSVQAFAVNASIEHQLNVTVQEIDLEGGIYRIGAGARSFDETKQRLIGEGEGVSAIRVISKMIELQVHRTVGGSLQAARLDESGFHQLDILDFAGREHATVRYLGIDTAEITRPRNFKFGVWGVSTNGPSADQLEATGNLVHSET